MREREKEGGSHHDCGSQEAAALSADTVVIKTTRLKLLLREKGAECRTTFWGWGLDVFAGSDVCMRACVCVCLLAGG